MRELKLGRFTPTNLRGVEYLRQESRQYICLSHHHILGLGSRRFLANIYCPRSVNTKRLSNIMY